MVMDRNRMSKPKRDTAYQDGVEQFLAFAYQNLPRDSEILCPCKKCKNRVNQNHDEVRTHLRCDGILQGYTTWVHHGESYESPSFAFVDLPNNTRNLPNSSVPRAATVHDHQHVGLDDMQELLQAAFVDLPNNTRNMPNSSVPRAATVHDQQHGGLDNMHELLQAAFGRAEIYESLPSMSEGNVDDDVQSEVGNMEHNVAKDVNPAEDDSTGTEQNMYDSYLNDAHTRLYPGCKFSRLSFLVTLYHLKFLYGWTQESFTSLLGLLSSALPPETNLPKTYYEAKKVIRVLGLHYVKIHACPKDCILFRDDTAELDFCPVCKSSRWKDNKRNGSTTNGPRRKRKPAKVLRYFPLIPRLKRLFSTNRTSDDMRWHDEGRTKDGKLRHPADGEAWLYY